MLVYRRRRITFASKKSNVRSNLQFNAHLDKLTLRARISLIGRDGVVSEISTNAAGDLATDAGNGVYGPTFPYPFALNFPATTGLSGIAVGDQKFPLQDSLFVIPTLSSIEPGLAEYNILDPAHVFTFNITAAVSDADLVCHCARVPNYLLKIHLFVYLASHFPTARHLESHFRDSCSATWEHESED